MKVMLATDGSPCSKAALEYLERLPIRDKSVEVLAVRTDLPALVHAEKPAAMSSLLDAIEHRIAEVLEDAANRLEARGWSVTKTLLQGVPSPEIIRYVRHSPPNLLVMGYHGHHAFDRFLPGNVTERVARLAPCSVLVVREGDHVTAKNPLRILLAYDDTEWSKVALLKLLELDLGMSEITVVRIMELLSQAGLRMWQQAGEIFKEKKKEAADSLETCRAKIEECGASCIIILDEHHKTALRLLEIAKNSDVDLVVCGSHRDKGIERFFFGNTVNQLLHGTQTALWIAR